MILSAIVNVALAVTSAGAPAPLTVERCDLGESYQFQIAECRFNLRNDGERELKIDNIKPVSEGDEVSIQTVEIPPHQEREITLSARIGNRLGPLIRFVSIDVAGETRNLTASGFVVSDLDNGAQRIDFGTVNAAKGSSLKVAELSSHEVDDFRILEISESPRWIEAKLGTNKRTVSARVLPGALWAAQEGYIKLKINTPHQHEAWIPVTANIQGDVIPSVNPFEVGAVHEGSTIEFAVRLTSRNGKSFKVGEVSSIGVPATVTEESCIPVSKDCRLLKARLRDDLPRGPFRGELQVNLPDYGHTLPITFGGLVVAKTSEIRKMPESVVPNADKPVATKDDEREVPPASASQPNLSGLLRDAAAQARAQVTLEVPPGTGPLLKWQVANEQQVYGYLINRSDNDKGPFVRINPDVIKAASSGSGWSYAWRDNSAEGGKTYWYFISVINKSGQIEPLSNPQKILAK
jgi:hypothetical protein